MRVYTYFWSTAKSYYYQPQVQPTSTTSTSEIYLSLNF